LLSGKWSKTIYLVILLVVLFGALIAGFELGYSTGTPSVSLGSGQLNPLSFGPFASSFVLQGGNGTAYVPVIVLAAGYSTDAYVEYDCGGTCQGLIGVPFQH
jgi:hypothetical protein